MGQFLDCVRHSSGDRVWLQQYYCIIWYVVSFRDLRCDRDGFSGASTDSSTIVAYNADSGALYGSLYHYPATDHPEGAMKNIYDWDSGVYLGESSIFVLKLNQFCFRSNSRTFSHLQCGGQHQRIRSHHRRDNLRRIGFVAAPDRRQD